MKFYHFVLVRKCFQYYIRYHLVRQTLSHVLRLIALLILLNTSGSPSKPMVIVSSCRMKIPRLCFDELSIFRLVRSTRLFVCKIVRPGFEPEQKAGCSSFYRQEEDVVKLVVVGIPLFNGATISKFLRRFLRLRWNRCQLLPGCIAPCGRRRIGSIFVVLQVYGTWSHFGPGWCPGARPAEPTGGSVFWCWAWLFV